MEPEPEESFEVPLPELETGDSEYETIVRNMIKGYETQLMEYWKHHPADYFRPFSTIPELWVLIQELNKHIYTNKYISDWRQIEEWPESEDYFIVYSIVNLLINQEVGFIPDRIKQFISEQVFKDPENEPKLLYNIYWSTYSNLVPLNNSLKENQVEIKGLKNELFSQMANSLYSSDDFIYLFSGMRRTVFSNDELYNMISSGGKKTFPLRSWTLDMRVAMQFTSYSDDSSRRDSRFYDGNPFRLIFITKQDKICYVSDTSSWEAEVLIPCSDYYYDSHFEIDIPFFCPDPESRDYSSDSEPKKFIFVVIDRIDNIDLRVMNKFQFQRYINILYEHFKKIQVEDAACRLGACYAQLDEGYERKVEDVYHTNKRQRLARSKKKKKKKKPKPNKPKKPKKPKNTKRKKKSKRRKN